MARVAIIGAGNLGGYLAATLKEAGHEVCLCVRRPPGVIRVDGLRPVRFRFFLQRPPQCDIALLTVKTYDTPGAKRWLQALCKDNVPVAVIQNGVGHAERVAPYPAIPVLCYVYVETRNGVHYPFVPPQAHFTVPALSSSNPFADLFANTPIQVEREGAFHSAAWRKMLQNCVSNPITTLTGKGLEVLLEPEYRLLAEQILAEAFPIAQADGAWMRPGEPEKILDVLASYPPGTRTSMLRDFELDRRLEIDSLNGALVEIGRKHGLPTTVNEGIVERLKAAVALKKPAEKRAPVG